MLVARVADRVELHLEAEAVAVEGQRGLHVGDRDPAVGEADDLDGRRGHAATSGAAGARPVARRPVCDDRSASPDHRGGATWTTTPCRSTAASRW